MEKNSIPRGVFIKDITSLFYHKERVGGDLTVPDSLPNFEPNESVASANVQKNLERVNDEQVEVEQRPEVIEVGNDLLRKLAFTLGFQQKSFCLTRDESNHFEMFGYEYIGEGSLVKDLEVSADHPLKMMEECIGYARVVVRAMKKKIRDQEEADEEWKAESEGSRLHRDRDTRVERTATKAHARLDKVKTYLEEQMKVIRPNMDLLNQAQGMEESLKAFIERGAIISKEEMSNIKMLKWMPSTSWI
ncbi:predicted protein [Arabidopsis lyrata subsp. lyrata]|uniref:Predicted protein n=1 Tax=Arabidopsis lyrata subsp. lyrata TaxID=81972 RepID=D7LET9_ARALL|nr:predicted protein [Arabidopsis lyrata subsp. lyrata]